MTRTPEEDGLLRAMAEEVDRTPVLHLAIAPVEAIRLAGLLQLAARHPNLEDGAAHGFAIAWFVSHVKAHFADCPATLEVIRRGDERRYDR